MHVEVHGLYERKEGTKAFQQYWSEVKRVDPWSTQEGRAVCVYYRSQFEK